MTDRLPDNLALLYEVFGEKRINDILPGEMFTVDGIEFVCKYAPESTAERFFIVKTPELFAQYRELCTRFQGATIFELGIAEGGSTALLALAARPTKLIAIDLEPAPVAALTQFIEQRGLDDVVRPYYGIDQSDRERLVDIVDTEVPDGTLDLVFDDASHHLHPTRASFEALFPRLRPGGLYMIEDWQSDHAFLDGVAAAIRDKTSPLHEQLQQEFRAGLAEQVGNPLPRKLPLTQLAVELLLARASWGPSQPIAEVTMTEYWLTVRRGPAELDATTFRLADLYDDHFGFLSFPNQS